MDATRTRRAYFAIDTALARARQRRRTLEQLPAPAVCRQIRVAADLSQQDIATPLRVTREAIAQWEKGRRRPRGGRAEAYLAILRRLQQAVQQAVRTNRRS